MTDTPAPDVPADARAACAVLLDEVARLEGQLDRLALSAFLADAATTDDVDVHADPPHWFSDSGEVRLTAIGAGGRRAYVDVRWSPTTAAIMGIPGGDDALRVGHRARLEDAVAQLDSADGARAAASALGAHRLRQWLPLGGDTWVVHPDRAVDDLNRALASTAALASTDLHRTIAVLHDGFGGTPLELVQTAVQLVGATRGRP